MKIKKIVILRKEGEPYMVAADHEANHIFIKNSITYSHRLERIESIYKVDNIIYCLDWDTKDLASWKA